MKISVITLFPDMIRATIQESIVKRAQEKQAVEIELINLRDFSRNSYGSVDDRPYGGGAGMVLRVDVLYDALQKALAGSAGKRHIALTSARGRTFKQAVAREFTGYDHLILIAGHYEGVDERILAYIDEELSIGDFVMTGGEIACAAIIDAVTRLLPGVLKKEDATVKESFSDFGGETLLEYPQYTRPEVFREQKVPDVLLSGNHREIEKWRLEEATKLTKAKRPDLLAK